MSSAHELDALVALLGRARAELAPRVDEAADALAKAKTAGAQSSGTLVVNPR